MTKIWLKTYFSFFFLAKVWLLNEIFCKKLNWIIAGVIKSLSHNGIVTILWISNHVRARRKKQVVWIWYAHGQKNLVCREIHIMVPIMAASYDISIMTGKVRSFTYNKLIDSFFVIKKNQYLDCQCFSSEINRTHLFVISNMINSWTVQQLTPLCRPFLRD